MANQAACSSGEGSASNRPERGSQTNPKCSGVDKYELEWQNLFTIANDERLYDLRHAAVRGDLRASPFRSICWSVFLGVLNVPSTSWRDQREASRREYCALKASYTVDPQDDAEHPLSQSKDSRWFQYFCDQELCAVIRQDVIRTFPGVDFFRRANVQEMMISILFCFARKYPSLCYRQGMHEILAPLIFVIHSDQQALAHIQELKPDIDARLVEILSPSHLEEDSYAIFVKIMDHIATFYHTRDAIPNASGHFPMVTTKLPASNEKRAITDILNESPISDHQQSYTGKSDMEAEAEVMEHLENIRVRILQKQDESLHNHLLQLEIPLSTFGVRWLRLLFGREFSLQDLLLLWDAIFGESSDLSLINFIVVAMLMRIREKLIPSDYNTCMTYLMHYPTNVDLSLIIRHALHMKSPTIYEMPQGAVIYVPSPVKKPPRQQHVAMPRSRDIERDQLKYSSLPRSSRLLAAASGDSNRSRTGSLPKQAGSAATAHETADELRQKASYAAKQAAAVASRLRHHERLETHNLDASIIDGYLENDPELLKIELQEAYNIMSVSRTKLLQYLALLRRHIRAGPTTTTSSIVSPNVQQSLDGIEEICSLLKPRFDTIFGSAPIPIDTAMEANELADGSESRTRPATAIPAIFPLANPYRLQSPPVSLNLQRSYNYDLDRRRRIATSSSSSPPISQYELPDDRHSQLATRKLANRREVEMNVFPSNVREPGARCMDNKRLPSRKPHRLAAVTTRDRSCSD